MPQMKRLITTEMSGGGLEKSKSVFLFSLGYRVNCQRKAVKPSCARTRKKNLLSIEFLAILNLLRQSAILSSSTSSSLSVYSVYSLFMTWRSKFSPSELASTDVPTLLATTLASSALIFTCSGLIWACKLCLLSERGGLTYSTIEDVFETASFYSS